MKDKRRGEQAGVFLYLLRLVVTRFVQRERKNKVAQSTSVSFWKREESIEGEGGHNIHTYLPPCFHTAISAVHKRNRSKHIPQKTQQSHVTPPPSFVWHIHCCLSSDGFNWIGNCLNTIQSLLSFQDIVSLPTARCPVDKVDKQLDKRAHCKEG